ncbi:hypothetical protein Tco_0683561 [Tanacetum coccineum]
MQSPLTYKATIIEFVNTWIRLTSIVLAMCKHDSNISYSDSLFEASKSNLRGYVKSCHEGLLSANHALEHTFLSAPSISITGLSTFARKYAMICPLIDCIDSKVVQLEIDCANMDMIRLRWGSKSSRGECWIAKPRISCDNTNRNTTLSEAQGGVPANHLWRESKLEQGSAHKSMIMGVSYNLRGVISRIMYQDLYLGGKALVERDNAGLDLTKSDLCPSFVKDLTVKGIGLRVVDSHTDNHREDDFTPQ